MIEKHALLKEIGTIARAAGKGIMRHYAGERQARAKEDRSPVTDADIEAHHYILERLTRLTPDIPVISEEDEMLASFTPSARYWLVDPLDGTRSFVRGEGQFTVNIGLVEEGYPVMGVIHIPQWDALYLGAANLGAFREEARIYTRAVPTAGMTAIKSSHHPSRNMENFLKDYPVHEVTSASSSVKFCILAEGSADLYPRLSRTMEWDTAAGQAILEAAGGRVETLEGERLSYGKPEFENPSFVAFGE